MVESDKQHVLGAWAQQHLIFESHGHQVIELSTPPRNRRGHKDRPDTEQSHGGKAAMGLPRGSGDHTHRHPSQSISEDVRGDAGK